jgi:hypothetical protein
MEKLKKLSLQLPEYLLICAVIFYWGSAGIVINPIAIVLIIGLILQIIFKNRILGLIIPSLLILMSFYMFLALMSEFNEFPTFNSDAKKLLFVGLSYFISTIIVSGLMIYRYSTMEKRKDQLLEI